MDDTGLVCYYKYDESTTAVPNSSQSSESGGTNFDSTANGATTNVSGHYGDCFSFDGTDDYQQCDISGGVNLSQWNFLKNGGDWSMSYWLRRFNLTEEGRLWDQAYDGGATLANATTNNIFAGTTGNSNLMVTNNTAGRPLDITFSSDYYKGDEWHFYCHMYNSATTSITSLLDNANSVTSSSGTSFSTNNATTDITFFRTVGSGGEMSAEVQDWTFWNVVLSQDNIDYLWNGGTGQGVYP
jgi:hypothetical protein